MGMLKGTPSGTGADYVGEIVGDKVAQYVMVVDSGAASSAAATEATLSRISAVLPSALGAKLSAQSVSVVLATDQSAGTLTGTSTPYTAATTIAVGAQSISIGCVSGTVTLAGGEILQAGGVRSFAAPYPYKLATFVISAGSNYVATVLR
jgi:hypothetical protein